MRPADVALTVLLALIILSPVFWWMGVALERVGAALAFWGVAWLIIAAVRRSYERS